MPRQPTSRLNLVVLIVATLGLCWLLMMATHELGHVLHARLSGGVVIRVALHPLAISRTDVAPNPHPLFVAWGGTIWGSAIPLALWLGVYWTARLDDRLPQFFAGFCLIANGAYLSGGFWMTAGDVADMTRHGGALWIPIAVGLPLVAGGLYLWHRLGRWFGLGDGSRPVDSRLAWPLLAALGVIVAVELIVGQSS